MFTAHYKTTIKKERGKFKIHLGTRATLRGGEQGRNPSLQNVCKCCYSWHIYKLNWQITKSFNNKLSTSDRFGENYQYIKK